MTKQIKAQKGSGNVFSDLGLPNAEERLLKAKKLNCIGLSKRADLPR